MEMTNAEKQAAYVARQNELGLKRIGVWVPKQFEQMLRNYAKELIKEGKNV